MRTFKIALTFNLFSLSVLFSFVFIVVFYSISLNTSNEHFSFANIGELHANNPAVWFIYILLSGIIWLTYSIENLRYKQNTKENYSNQTYEFAQELEQGNLEAQITIKSKDRLAQVLINLRDRLKNTQIAEQSRIIEEKQRNWNAEGIAKFSEIIRTERNSNFKEFLYELISQLVKYLEINQGGIYLTRQHHDDDLDKDEKYFELMASYAFDRKKHTEKRIEWGEGLIGTCALEKDMIYITNLPEDYINITSGLGDAAPKALLITPLLTNDNVYGIIELAAFDKLPQYKIEFIKRITETIASAIASIENSNRTAKLLERSQYQAQELASQEEELRQNIEEMKATQESLEESQAKTNMIIENAKDAIITIDKSGRIDQFSPSAQEIFGYEASEMHDELIQSLFSEKSTSIFKDLLKLSNEDLDKTFELECIRKDKKQFSAELIMSMAYLNDQKMYLVVLRDISERKQAEEERQQYIEEIQATQESLEESEAKTKMVFENAMDAIITIDEKGTIDQFSPSAEKLFGYTAKEVHGQNIKMLMPKEYSTHHDQYLENYKETGHKKVIGRAREEKGKTKDGTVFNMELRVEEAHLGNKKMFVGIVRDISEQKQSEQELRQQMEEVRSQDEELRQNMEELQATQEMIEEREAKIRMIFDNAMDAIVTIDQRGLIDQFNPSAERMFGYPADEIIGNNVNVLMATPHAENHDDYLKRYMRTGDKQIIGKSREETGKRSDGTTFPIEIRVEEAWLGNERMFIGMLRDITLRKEAEEEIQQKIEELETQDEMMKSSLKELKNTQKKLKDKDIEQKSQIEKLISENDKKIKEIEKIHKEQKQKDAKTKELYEGEINEMFEIWQSHLAAIEKKN